MLYVKVQSTPEQEPLCQNPGRKCGEKLNPLELGWLRCNEQLRQSTTKLGRIRFPAHKTLRRSVSYGRSRSFVWWRRWRRGTHPVQTPHLHPHFTISK